MSRKASTRNHAGRITYEAKLRKPGDRINAKGDKVEGGKTFSRHFEANNPDHAKRIAQRIAKKFRSRVVSVGKVHPEDIIGDHRTWQLEKILGIPMPQRRRDVILDNVTLDEIVYKKV